MGIHKENNRTAIIVAIIGVIGTIVSSIISIYLNSELSQLQNQTQQISVNIYNALGEQVAGEMNISETSDIEHVTNELTQAYLNEVDKAKQMEETQNVEDVERKALQNEITTLKQNNEALVANVQDLNEQVSNLKGFILEKYPSSAVDQLIEVGFVQEVAPTRLDSLDVLDGERYEQVSSVKDLYGTTHSVSYKMHAYSNDVAWVKFKLDNQYDRFTANIVTSEYTSRDAVISVEVYVDGNLKSRVDDIVRSEEVWPISANVNGGSVLMIKVIGKDRVADNICYISDGYLTKLK